MSYCSFRLPVFVVTAVPVNALANGWVRGVEVTQIGTYQAANAHLVWFGSLSQEYKSSLTMYFDKGRESEPGVSN